MRNDLILHHFEISPFSEKIRLILAHKQLPWKSVLVPQVMPKPDVVALTGGYRKTPFLQIGADIYCDTALICDVLEHAQPSPTLYPAHNKGAARIIAQWGDATLFWAAMAYSVTGESIGQLFKDASPEAARIFSEDRARMRVAIPRMGHGDAAAAYRSYLRRLANMLDEQPFLMGTQPCIADFSAYHPLWFTRHVTPIMAGIFDATPAVLHWMDRMAGLGKPARCNLSPAEAISTAAGSTPAVLHDETFLDEHGIALGTLVTIASDSFGPEPTTGELLAATRMHYTLRRVDERAGTVHVHFPRIGYVMRAVPAG